MCVCLHSESGKETSWGGGKELAMSGVPLAAQPAPACCQGLWEQITWAGAASTYGCSHRSRDCPPCGMVLVPKWLLHLALAWEFIFLSRSTERFDSYFSLSASREGRLQPVGQAVCSQPLMCSWELRGSPPHRGAPASMGQLSPAPAAAQVTASSLVPTCCGMAGKV